MCHVCYYCTGQAQSHCERGLLREHYRTIIAITVISYYHVVVVNLLDLKVLLKCLEIFYLLDL